MFLPSEVARLVLSYLLSQAEELPKTLSAFLEESPHLQEISDAKSQNKSVNLSDVARVGFKNLMQILKEYSTIMGLAQELYLRDDIIEPVIHIIKNLVGLPQEQKSGQPSVFQSNLDSRSGTMASISQVLEVSQSNKALDHSNILSEVDFTFKASSENKDSINLDMMATELAKRKDNIIELSSSPFCEDTIVRTTNTDKHLTTNIVTLPKSLSSSTESLLETTLISIMDKKPNQGISMTGCDNGDVECAILERKYDTIDSLLYNLHSEDSHTSTVQLLKNQDESQSSK